MKTITAYHSSSSPTLDPGGPLHVGTIEQARMRGGRYLHEVMLRPAMRMTRLRDEGSWRKDAVMRHARRSPVVVYLNRYEGIPAEAFVRARAQAAEKGVDLDALSDSQFRRLLPEAQDSWIVLDPAAATSTRRIDWPRRQKPRPRKRGRGSRFGKMRRRIAHHSSLPDAVW